MFIEWLYTDTINEEKINLRKNETLQLFSDALKWAKNSHAEKFVELLWHFITKELNHTNYSDFLLLFESEKVIVDR